MQIIRKAVSGMLPKNTLRDRRLSRLLIFPDEEHPYEQNILRRYDLAPFKAERDAQLKDSAAKAEVPAL
jgi:large subunit ribosomal protein L13